MTRSFESLTGAKLPRWLVVTGGAAGVLTLAVGMSRLVRMSALSEALPSMLLGSVMIYICGFKKRLCMDDTGISQLLAFWGRKKEKLTPWEEISDARVILNGGKKVYVILHGADKIPPFTLRISEAEGVVALLREKLADGKIRVEK